MGQSKTVSGLCFQDEKAYEEAKKEAEAVEYIKQQVNMDNPNQVLLAYKQIIERDIFHTAIGVDFLRGVQNFLYTAPNIDKDDIPDIPISSFVKKEKKSKQKSNHNHVTAETNDVKQIQKYRERNHLLLGIIVALVVAIIAMFFITLSSNQPTIINYQNKLIDKYASWEEDLTKRESQVKEKENELLKWEETLEERENQLLNQSGTQQNDTSDNNQPIEE